MAAIPADSTAAGADALKVDHVAVPRSTVEIVLDRLRSKMHQRVFERAAREVAHVLQTGDRDALLRAAPGWRARARRFGTPSAAAMAQALDGVRVVPAGDMQVSASWIESERFEGDGALVYVPGGSFVVGFSPRLAAMVARIAKAAQTRTCVVAYRLAPEHPCPAAVDDVERAVLEMIERGRRPARIAVLAESAGAAIALSAVQRLRDRGVALAGMCFLSPWTDLALTGLSVVTHSLNRQSNMRMEFPAICAHLYLQGRNPFDPVASPVYGDLHGLPPMLVHTSRSDGLHDDACTLSERAFRAGTDVTLRIWPHGTHVFEQGFNAQSERAIADAGAFIRARLNA